MSEYYLKRFMRPLRVPITADDVAIIQDTARYSSRWTQSGEFCECLPNNALLFDRVGSRITL
jgi:hypothetical protein